MDNDFMELEEVSGAPSSDIKLVEEIICEVFGNTEQSQLSAPIQLLNQIVTVSETTVMIGGERNLSKNNIIGRRPAKSVLTKAAEKEYKLIKNECNAGDEIALNVKPTGEKPSAVIGCYELNSIEQGKTIRLKRGQLQFQGKNGATGVPAGGEAKLKIRVPSKGSYQNVYFSVLLLVTPNEYNTDFATVAQQAGQQMMHFKVK